MSQIDLFRQYPIDTQHETFVGLIDLAKDTEWGKLHGYKSINNFEQYKSRVPIQDYDDIKKHVIRLRHGEQNILWPTDIKWFAKSSGTTTDKSKFIPVSKEALEDCHFRGGKDNLVIYMSNNPDSKMLKGKGLVLGGSHQINNFSSDSYYGDLSAVLIQNLPFWATFLRTPNTKIALMDEWENKIEKMAHATIPVNVTNLAGVPSWFLVLIRHILDITGKDNLLDVWPNLELFTHGGVSFTPYKEQYERIIPSDQMNYLETYNASEGFFAIQDDPNRDDLLLMLDYGIFYEFIALEDIHEETPKTYLLDEVELDKNYAIVITTNGGLWRYMIGDTVKFTSKYPFKIKITGRTKHYINAFGEEIIIDNAETALMAACERTNARIKEFSAGPIFMDNNSKGRHEWLFEFEIAPDNIEHFTELLDNELKSVNSDYEAKRYKNLTLDMPKVTCVKPGTFYEWLKQKGKLGGQNKVPRLANDRQYVDELLKINEKL